MAALDLTVRVFVGPPWSGHVVLGFVGFRRSTPSRARAMPRLSGYRSTPPDLAEQSWSNCTPSFATPFVPEVTEPTASAWAAEILVLISHLPRVS